MKRVLNLLRDGITDEDKQYLDEQIDLAIALIPQGLLEAEQKHLEDARENAARTSNIVTRISRQFRNACNEITSNDNTRTARGRRVRVTAHVSKLNNARITRLRTAGVCLS